MDVYQPLSLDALAPEPWRNGRGITRTVAVDAAGADWRWRISLADLSGTAPFSRFPGVDRSAVLVRGSGLALSVDGAGSELERPGQRRDFAGESDVWAATPRGPARLWNVMTRRGAAHAELRWLTQPAVLLDAGLRVLLAVDAPCQVRCRAVEVDVAPGHYWIPPEGELLQVEPAPGGGLLSTRIAIDAGIRPG